MEFFASLLALLVFMAVLIVSAVLTRWIFRIDDIIKILGATKENIEDIRNQNSTLIKQQDEIIYLLEADPRQDLQR
jgi:hypothetical protein